MEMIKTRNKAVHTYDEAIVSDVIDRTTQCYYPLFLKFKLRMQGLLNAI